MDLSKVTNAERAIVFATLMGPILAVQAQKFLEELREYRAAKLWIFRSLMTTRMQRESVDHVRALNMMDICFYGKRVFVWHRQTASEKKFAVSWKIYLNNLTTDIGGWSDSQQQIHFSHRNKQFNSLLSDIGAAVGYHFDEVHIEKAGYIPVAHDDNYTKQRQLLESAVHVLQDKQSIKMDVVSFPSDANTAENYQKMIAQISTITEGGALKVTTSWVVCMHVKQVCNH